MSECASLDGATFVCLQVNVANSLGCQTGEISRDALVGSC